MSRILIVDDEEGIREILRDYLEIEGHEVHEAAGGFEAWDFLGGNQVDLVITDVKMPSGMGTELLHFIKERDCRKPSVAFITGYSDFNIDEAYAMGVEGFLHKPFTRQNLLEMVARMTKSRPELNPLSLEGLPALRLHALDLLAAIEMGRMSVGRGGFCLRDIGQTLALDQDYGVYFGTRLFAAATVRWVRSQGQSADAGLEVFWLNPQDEKVWNDALMQVDPRIYIPRHVRPGRN